MNHGTTHPKVSIGLPTYNGEQGLTDALNSMLSQTFTDFELIISDNASSDRTQLICSEYISKDKRVRYIRQDENIGIYANFQFVLDEALGEYFMWIADDDKRSSDFLEEAVSLLESNHRCVAATTPDRIENESLIRDFSISGNKPDRMKSFINKCWISHGIFYSLGRTKIIKDFDFTKFEILGGDWAYDIYLASKGEICRSKNGLTVFSKGGVSTSDQRFSMFRRSWVNWMLPFYDFSVYIWELSRSLPFKYKIGLIFSLLKLNFFTSMSQLRLEISLRI